MKRAAWKVNTLAMLLALLVCGAFVVGCNEQEELDPDLFFSLEDYATDFNYVNLSITMMNNWMTTSDRAKEYLFNGENTIPFDESEAQNWSMTDDSAVLQPLYPETPWYYKSFQDAQFDLLMLNRDVPAEIERTPAKIEYQRRSFRHAPAGTNAENEVIFTGDSVAVAFADNFQNRQILEGQAMYTDIEILFYGGSTSAANLPAVMDLEWHGELSNLSPERNNPEGHYVVTGKSTISRIDSEESVTVDVEVTFDIRSSRTGEGVVKVNGIKRGEIFIDYIDTRLGGYYTLRSNDFQDKLSFS